MTARMKVVSKWLRIVASIIVWGCLTQCRTKSLVGSDSAEPTPPSTTSTTSIVIHDDLLFEANSSVLSDDGRRILIDKFADMQSLRVEQMTIEAHSRLASREELNQRLTRYRAQTIGAYLTDSLAISPDGLHCIGQGSAAIDSTLPKSYTRILLRTTNYTPL